MSLIIFSPLLSFHFIYMSNTVISEEDFFFLKDLHQKLIQFFILSKRN